MKREFKIEIEDAYEKDVEQLIYEKLIKAFGKQVKIFKIEKLKELENLKGILQQKKAM